MTKNPQTNPPFPSSPRPRKNQLSKRRSPGPQKRLLQKRRRSPKDKRGDQSFGRFAEDVVAFHYEMQGFEVLERNFRCRRGELDLILQSDKTLLFVEVRGLRGAFEPCRAMASVNSHKQRRLLQAAHRFLAGQDQVDCEIQFNVCGVVADQVGSLTLESWSLEMA